MNQRLSLALDVVGCRELPQFMYDHIVKPMSKVLYPAFGESLDYFYGFVNEYVPLEEAKKDSGRNALRTHTDDSEVTLNINLGLEFEGGDLIFSGQRGTTSENKENIQVKPVMGSAILHIGQHLHSVLPVTSGKRYSLILWFRSSKFRTQTCPCCLIHNRQKQCVCLL
jgi:predicted 2-oxoglutarate/Fe(II)-dependent dioxygenase YbiX